MAATGLLRPSGGSGSGGKVTVVSSRYECHDGNDSCRLGPAVAAGALAVTGLGGDALGLGVVAFGSSPSPAEVGGLGGDSD